MTLQAWRTPGARQPGLPGYGSDDTPGPFRSVVPLAGPSLDLQFAGTGTLDPRITYTGTGGTYFNSAGVLTAATTNVARFDFNPVSLAPRGLLIEEARTNSVLNSSYGSWANNGPCNLNLNAVTGLNGATSAATVLAFDTTNSVRWIAPATIAAAGATAYVLSAYVKSTATPTNCWIAAAASGGAACVAYFDLGVGAAVVGADLVAGFTAKSVNVTQVGSWWRCQFGFTTPAGTTTLVPDIGPSITVSSSGDNRSYTGVVGQGIILDCCQLEAGAFATSPIPTAGAAATRAVDRATFPAGNWFNSAAGSWVAECVPSYASPSVYARIVASSTAYSGAMLFFWATALNAGSYDGVTSTLQTANAAVVGAIAKLGSTWAAGIGMACLNGGTPVTGSQGTGFASLTSVQLMSDNANEMQSGYIRRVRYWPRVLAPAELQAMTV